MLIKFHTSSVLVTRINKNILNTKYKFLFSLETFLINKSSVKFKRKMKTTIIIKGEYHKCQKNIFQRN